MKEIELSPPDDRVQSVQCFLPSKTIDEGLKRVGECTLLTDERVEKVGYVFLDSCDVKPKTICDDWFEHEELWAVAVTLLLKTFV